MTGWCNSGAMGEMFNNMESGAPVPIGRDTCPDEGIQSSIDLCEFGMKDTGDSYGFGANVLNFENASVCNKEKLSSFVMNLFDNFADGGGGAFGGGFSGGAENSERIGNGNETIKLFVYLDTDGSTTDGCSLSDNSSATGYEFRLKYVAEWNSTLGKAVETFNAYKCTGSDWETTDIKLGTLKQKMCGEIGGPMIAIKKDDLVKYPTLYDSTADMRVYVATAGNTGNISSPLDSAGPGWITPGSVDFDISNYGDYGVDTSKFEDILRSGFSKHENCFEDVDVDGDGLVGCEDYDCQDASQCSDHDYSNDTRSPQVIGVKIEEYPDAALVMYDTNKLTNGTLLFYETDSQCLTLNESIYDSTTKTGVRDYLNWHEGKIYNDESVANISLNFDLEPETTYYYKLKVCDSNNKCAISKCSSIKTPSEGECGYCDFVTRIKTPDDWEVSYDLDANGTYEHIQGEVCGPTSGMKTNYTSGRRSNVKLTKSDESVYIEFLNVSLTKTGLSDKVRTISDAGDIISDSAIVGLTSETRDKIINNLHPEACRIKIPTAADGSCDTLYHCDEAGENCVDRTEAAGGEPINVTECIWNVPYCEFSTYRVPESDDGVGNVGAGGSSGSGAKNVADPVSGFILTNVVANGEAKFSFDLAKVPVSEVNFISNTELLNAKITVTAIKTETATAAVGAINGKVFQYLKIEKAGFGDNVFSKANIKFKVDKIWLTQNAVDKNSVALYRFENSWGTLTTTILSEDATTVYYSAETSGFSYFAIGEKTTSVLPIEQQPGETTGTDGATTNEEGNGIISKQTNSIIVLVVLVILIVGLIGFFISRGKKH